jgi:alkylation response protein AidB-like acyl-CoA dehydrogenase
MIDRESTDIVEWLRTYAADRIDSATIDERRCIPPHLVLDFGNRGLLGMLVEPRHLGLGLGHTQAARVLEQLGAIDLTICLFVGLNNYLGVRPIAGHAQSEVKDELLPRLATGRELAAFALTEPGAGSNPHAMSSRAELVAPDRWRLYGTKYWIGAAQWAGVINVFVREGTTRNIGAHLLRQGSHGLKQGPEAPSMGMRGMIKNSFVLDGAVSTRRDRLGVEGGGLLVAHDAMMYARLAIGAGCIGSMQRCAQLALRYATRRQISTGLLLANPTTLGKLSRMTAAITALRCLVYGLARAADSGRDVPIEGFTACKTAGPELLWTAIDDLMQLLGGRGYMESSPVPQMMRDARALRVFEGPTETMQAFLGSRLMATSPTLIHLIGETLGARHLVPRIEEMAEAVRQRSERLGDPLAAGAIHWSQMRAGRLATWLILRAAIEGDVREASTERRRAALWVQGQIDQDLFLLAWGTPEEATLLGGAALTDVIGTFSDTIGDLVQTLPRMDHRLDPLLTPERPAFAESLRQAPQPPNRARAPRASRDVELRRIMAWITTNTLSTRR